VPFLNRYPTPAAPATPYWYSVTIGTVFLAAVSSEHNFTEGSQQWLWLDAALGAVNRSVTPWVVVSMHRPIYSTQMCEAGDYEAALHFRAAFDPLFWRHRVNVALVAHTHAYERTCAVSTMPGANCTAPGPACGCAPTGTGTTHLTIGTGGVGLERCGYSPQLGAFSMSRLNGRGVLFLDDEPAGVEDEGGGGGGARELRLRFALGADGSTFDEAVVRPWSEAAARRVEAAW